MIRRTLLVLVGWVLLAGVTSGVAEAQGPQAEQPSEEEVAAGDPGPLRSGPRDLVEELGQPGASAIPGTAERQAGDERAAREDERASEIVGLRSEGAETYRLESGLRQTELFMEPRWYRDDSDAWARVDPGVRVAAWDRGLVEATGVGWKASFDVARAGVSVSFEGRSFAMAIGGTNGEARPEVDPSDDTVVWYRDVWPGVDARYTVTPMGLKEDFIVESAEGFRSAGTFPVEVTSEGRLIPDPRLPGGYLLDWDGDGKTAIDDPNQGPRFELPPPLVSDATGQFLGSDRVALALDPKAEASVDRRSRTIGLSLPRDWVESLRPEQFPVTVDPSVMIIPSTMGGAWQSYRSDGAMTLGMSQWGLLGNWQPLGADMYWRFRVAPGYQHLWTTMGLANPQVFGANLKLDTTAYPVWSFPFDNWLYPTSSADMLTIACDASNVASYAGAFPNDSTCTHSAFFGLAPDYSILGGHASTTLVDVSKMLRPRIANKDTYGVIGVSVQDWPGNYTFKSTVMSVVIDWDQPSPTVPLVQPADGATVTSTTPTLQVGAVTDPDPSQTQQWYSASVFAGKPTGLADDPTNPCRSKNAVWSSNFSNGTTSWTVPDNVLSDGVTYYWTVGAIGIDPSAPLASQLKAVASCGGPWKFKVDRRLGASGVSPMETVGPFSVNMANGNVVVSGGAHSVTSVGGSIAPGFTYNSQAKVQHGLRASYYGGTFPDPSNSRLPVSFSDPAFAQRVDPAIDFDWQTHGPIGTYALDNFWAQWHGFITVPVAGNYCFGTRADDGTQMWINGAAVINNWVDQSATDAWCVSPTFFNAGETKEILVRYYEFHSGASIQLKLYSAPSGVSTGVVPSAWLSTEMYPLGPGWSMNAGDVAVSGARASGSGVTITLSDGSTVEYTKSDSGAYVGPPGDGTTVSVDRISGEVAVVDDAGTAYKYSSQGTLLSAVSATDDRSPAATKMVWSGSPPRLTGMQDPVSGDIVTLSYGGDLACTTPPSGFVVAPGQLCKVASWDGRETDLFYNSNRQLARIVGPGDGTIGNDITDFAYDGSNRMTAVRQPLAYDAVDAGLRTDDATVRWAMTYDGSGRASVATAPAPTAGVTRQTTTLGYVAGPPTGVSTITATGVSNPSGYTKRYEFDASYRTTKVTDTGGQVSTIVYDGASDRVSHTDTNVGTAQQMRSSTVYDSTVVFNGLSRPITAYGPAPSSLFQTNSPLPVTPGTVPKTETVYDGSIYGLSAAWWNDTAYTGTVPNRSAFLGAPRAHTLLTGASSWNWGTGSPDSAIVWDYFSGRLSGLVYLPTAGTYTFGATADDSARVTIDDTVVADTWTSPLGSSSKSVPGLAAGWHRISIDLREDLGGASLVVWYLPPGGVVQAIPATSLKPDFGLVTSSVDTTGVTTTTSYADPVIGLATSSTVDPGGLALTSTTSYETPGTGKYFRRTARALPMANAGGTSTSTYTPYGAAETAPAVTCAGSGVSVTSVNQRGLPRYSKAADPNIAGGPGGIQREQVQDLAGRVVASRVTSDATWSCTQFDARGRVTKQTYPASATEPARTVTTTYSTTDPFLTTVSDPAGTISTRVDLLGRVTDMQDVWGTITHTDYDLAGRATQSTVFNPSGTVFEAAMSDYQPTGVGVNQLAMTRWTPTLSAVTSTVYDFAKLQVKTGQSMPTTTGTTLVSIGFDAIGRPSTYTYSSGVVSTHSYDTFGRPSGITHAKSPATLMSETVTRDLSGRIVDQTLDGQDANPSGANFTYDNAGRLTGWYVGDPSTSTTYRGTENYGSYTGGAPAACAGNGWGSATSAGLNSNRLESTLQVNGGTTATTKYCYDHADRLQKAITPGGQANPYATGFAYDDHGNATSVGTETRVYDSADRHVGTHTGTITTPKTALEVVGNPGALTARDTWVKDQLERAGWTVTVADDNGITAAAATGKQLVVITDSVGSSTVGNTFKTTAVPVIVAEAYILDDMGMTGTASTEFGDTTSQTQVAITTAGAASPLGAGLAAGTHTTSTTGITHSWGKPAAAAIKVATLAGDASKAAVFAYNTGATMNSGTAPARRLGWFQYEGSTSTLTASAVALFQAAVAWAANLPTTPTALLVVGNPGSLSSRDTWLRDRLQDAGWNVTLADDNGIAATAAGGKQLVVISESVAAGTVAGTFTNVAVPVIVAETYVLDDMGMVGTASTELGDTPADQTQVVITTTGSTHPLGAGLPAGNVTTSTTAVNHGWGKPAGSAVVAATLPSDATKATVFGYDTGTTMSTGTAPARRAAWFHYSGAGTSLNEHAVSIFDAIVTWAAQTTPTIRYGRDAANRIIERKVNTRTAARYSYSASGDTSDLTLDGSSGIVEATINVPGGALYTWRTATPVWSYPNIHGDFALTTNNSGSKQGSTRAWNPWGDPFTNTADQDNSAGEFDYAWHGMAQRPLEHQSGSVRTLEMGLRQYDSALGRFLEIDPIEGGAPNDFAYASDPVNQADLTGETVFGICAQAEVVLGIGRTAVDCFVVDTRGNMGFALSGNAGWFPFSVGLSAGVGGGFMISNARSIFDLEGDSECSDGNFGPASATWCRWGSSWAATVAYGAGWGGAYAGKMRTTVSVIRRSPRPAKRKAATKRRSCKKGRRC